MLSLSDPVWQQYQANYTDGARVAGLLSRAEAGEPPDRWYHDLFQELCHQSTVSEAAYPAAPHLVRLADSRPELRKHLLVLLGCCHAFSEPGMRQSLLPEVVRDWRDSAADAIPLIAGLLAEPQTSESDLRYLLCAMAAFQGFPGLGAAIEALDIP